MDAIRSRWKDWLLDVLPQVVRQANISKPTGEMVYQIDRTAWNLTVQKYYKCIRQEIL